MEVVVPSPGKGDVFFFLKKRVWFFWGEGNVSLVTMDRSINDSPRGDATSKGLKTNLKAGTLLVYSCWDTFIETTALGALKMECLKPMVFPWTYWSFNDASQPTSIDLNHLGYNCPQSFRMLINCCFQNQTDCGFILQDVEITLL